MAGPIGVLRAELSANIANFKQNMDAAKSVALTSSQGIARAFDTMGRSAKQTAAQIFSFRNALNTISMITGISGISIGVLAKQTLEFADTLVKTSSATGMSIKSLQELRFAAQQSGLSSEQLDTALKMFTKTVGQAHSGTGALAETLKRMDPATLALIRGATNTESALGFMLKAIDKTKNSSDRAALSAAAFGKAAGVDMLAMLAQGTAGLDGMRKEANDFGLVLEESLVRDAEAAKDQLERLGLVVTTGLMAAILPAIPAIGEMSRVLAVLATGAGLTANELSRMADIGKLISISAKAATGNLGGATEEATAWGLGADKLKAQNEELERKNNLLKLKPAALIPDEKPLEAPGKALTAKDFRTYGPPVPTQDFTQLNAAKKIIEETTSAQEKERIELEKIAALRPMLTNMLGSEAEAGKRVAAAQEQVRSKYHQTHVVAVQAHSAIAAGLTDAIMESQDLNVALQNIIRSLAQIVIQFAMMKAVGMAFGGMGMPIQGWSAHGNAFSGGRRLTAYRRGGIVNGATLFPMARGAGMMGEAGPEGILPLKRIGGDLGVKAELPSGGGVVSVQQTINVAGADFSDPKAIRKIMQAVAEEAKAGTKEALRMAGLLNDQANINSRRAF